jgi:ABC-2 type transport system permease protein
MKTKELLETRWKVVTFILLAIIGSAGNIALYPFDATQPSNESDVPSALQNLAPANLHSFNAFVWERWFSTNGPFWLGIFAAILGGGLIASEVSKGTIFFLLSKPISREHILLTKYGVSASLLLAVSVICSIAIAIVSILLGYTPALLPLLFATGLLWLANLFPLGLSLFFSVVLSDNLRSVVFSLLIIIALTLLPALLPNGMNWSLLHYWNNQESYLAGSFPLKEYLICLVIAAVPLLAALVVFRQKAY